ncbi:MAG: hypothetical protein IKT33_04225 [Clostridia bacterium]|nr:hypothetical protein [Clostridia bacterium]
MLFNYELKKILRRVSPLMVLTVIILTSMLSMSITYFCFTKEPTTTINPTTEYAALETKIKNWDEINRDNFDIAFNNFNNAYKALNASTFDGKDLIKNYKKASTSFATFYVEHYQNITNKNKNITNYLLIQKQYIDNFNQIMTSLDSYFSLYLEGYPNDEARKKAITDGLQNTNPSWNNQTLKTILNNLFFVQKISASDKLELQTFFSRNPSNQTRNYTDAYDYALNRYWTAIASASEYDGKLSEYEGFDGYINIATSSKAYKLAEYRLSNPEKNFTTPFSFGNIFTQNSKQISLFDFVFNNLEITMLIVLFLTIIWAGSAFFTDKQTKTLITPIATGKNRTHIILCKMTVVLVLAVTALLIFTGIFTASGLLLFNASISPDILFLFNGTTPAVMSPANYFAIYFLNLIWKLLPFIALCGLFSFIKTKPFVIIGCSLLCYLIVVILNACFGGLWLYQFIPLLGLDPIRYFGAELMLSPMPSTYNILYTVPVTLLITIGLYWALISKFKKHDFY